jgi:4'-phosphopantetheinyl transferase
MESVPFDQITIANTPEGAPYVQVAGNVLPVPLSISHREGCAVAAVSTTHGVGLGIDLEWVEDHPQSFYEDFFTTEELRILGEYAADKRAWAGSLMWSAKEAVLKALGLGLRLDTRTVEILRIANAAVDSWGTVELRVTGTENDIWYGYWRNLGQHVLTLAVRGTKTRPIIQQTG